MEAINELELRRLLKQKLSPQELLNQILKILLANELPWEQQRPFFDFLYLTERHSTLITLVKEVIENKNRIPYDMMIEMLGAKNIEPKTSVMEALLKGLRRHGANADLFAARSWDRFDKRLVEMRNEMVEAKIKEQRQFKDNMIDKFHFLRNQRMVDQAGQVLRRMIELYPEDESLKKLKEDFDEQWAREVLANHMAKLSDEKIERTLTAPSSADEEMLNTFLASGEKLALQDRNFATDLAIAFWFMDEPNRALEILAWAPPSASNDWLKAELLHEARRFIEALEHLNTIEVRYIDDPETTFGVSYMRALALHELGQTSSALEILQSIVRVRPNYRSAHSLILEWSEGASWE